MLNQSENNTSLSYISLLSIFFWVLLNGCYFNSLDSDFSKFKFKNQNITTININPLEALEELKASTLIKKIKYLRLNCPEGILFGNSEKIKFYKDKILLMESFPNPSLTCFDTTGTFLYQKNNVGKGPGEFIDLEDFIINRFKGHLEIYERTRKKIFVYDIENGNFIEDRDIGIYSFEIDYYDENHYISFGDEEAYEIGHPLRNMFIMLNVTTKEPKYSLFPYVSGRDDFSTPGVFSFFKDRFLFTHLMNDTIWQIEESGLNPMFYINFGSNRAHKDVIGEKNMEIKYRKFAKNNYASFIHELNETEDILCFWYRFGGEKQNLVIHFKYANKTFNIGSFRNDIDGGIMPFPKATFGNKLVSLIYPSELLLQLKKLNIPDQVRTEQLQGILQDANKDDNPYLMLLTLKSK